MLWLLPFLSCVSSSSLAFSEDELVLLATCSVFSALVTCLYFVLWRWNRKKPRIARTAKFAIIRQRLKCLSIFPYNLKTFFFHSYIIAQTIRKCHTIFNSLQRNSMKLALLFGIIRKTCRKRGKTCFYAYLRGLVVFLLWIINGNAHYHNRDKLLNKDENYILVAPHRTWWDPCLYGIFQARPKQFIFMAKKELFKESYLWLVDPYVRSLPN